MSACSYARWRALVTRFVLLAIALLPIASCGGGAAERTELDRQEIEQLLRDYLPKMGSAYATGDFAPLEGLAAQKEIAILQKHVGDLWEQEGRLVEAELVELEIESLRSVNRSIALVTTLETWNLRTKPIGSDRVLSEVENQRNRARYMLEREDHGWKVMERVRQATFE